jgi:hypothetical protein
MQAYNDIVNNLFILVYPSMMIACLVLGIIIICKKDRATKMLGVWFAVTALSGLIYSLFIIFIGFISKIDVSLFVTARTIITGILGYASVFAFFMYAKLRYNVKAYWLIIILAGSVTLTFVINISWQLAFRLLYTEKRSLALQFVRSIVGIIPSVVENVIFLVIYLKNRPVEKELKLLYLRPLSVLIFDALTALVYTVGCFVPSEGSRRMRVMESVSAIALIINILNMVVFILFAIYVLAKGRRQQPEKLEIV